MTEKQGAYNELRCGDFNICNFDHTSFIRSGIHNKEKIL